MEIQEIIESAIKGGWNPFGIGINLKKEGWGHKEVMANFFYQSPYLLDKNFWIAVATTELGFDERFIGKAYIEEETTEWARMKMHAMISHIMHTGTAESYIKSL